MKSFFCVCCFLLSFHANGQSTYVYNWKKETVIFSGSGLMVGASYYIDSKRDPLIVPPVGSAPPIINWLDRGALDNYSTKAKSASDVLFYSATLAPLSLLGSRKLKGSRIPYLLMYSEVVALNGGVTLLVKSAVNRKRPFFFNDEVPLEERQSLDARKSFFSGHTSHTAALSFFSATVFSDLYPSSPWRYVVWGGSIAIPAATAYLRVNAGRHYISDVLVGYGVGAAIGVLIPYLHRVQIFEESTFMITPYQSGLHVSLIF